MASERATFLGIAVPPRADEGDAFAAGYHAGMNGPNTDNCHSRYFRTPALCAEWERGQEAGRAAVATPTSGAP